MLSNTQTDKLLDDCFNGIIKPEQLAEALLINDKVVAETLVNEHLVAITAVQQYQIIQQVKQVHSLYANTQEEAKETTVVRPLFSLKIALHVAAMLLLTLSSWLVYEYNVNSYKKIYANMFASYTVNEVRGNGEGQLNPLVEAYRSGDFLKTTNLFTTIANPTSRDLFFTAMSYLEMEKPAEAVPLFNKIYAYNKTNNEQLYEDETDYYLALTLLKLQQKEEAIKLFEKIKADKEHTYNMSVKSSTILKIKWFGH